MGFLYDNMTMEIGRIMMMTMMMMIWMITRMMMMLVFLYDNMTGDRKDDDVDFGKSRSTYKQNGGFA